MSAKTPLPTTFHLFTSLPAELRHQIWLLSLPLFASPINMQIAAPKPKNSHHPPAGWRILTPAQRVLPPFLAVCHESRDLALAFYAHGMDIQRDWDFRGEPPLVVGPGWGRAWRQQFLRFLERSVNACEYSRVCAHERKFQSRASQLYWDPARDWLQLSFAPASSRRCGSRALCRSDGYPVETRFDVRLAKVVMEDSVYEYFHKQNRERVLVAFEGIEGAPGEEMEEVLCTPLKNGGKWMTLNRIELLWEDNPWFEDESDDVLDRAMAAAYAAQVD